MRKDTLTLLLAAGLGAISGVRSMSGIAMLSDLDGANGRSSGRISALLGSKHAGKITSLLAAGEMTADKAADLPPRTDASSLVGRAMFGALSGAAVAEMRDGRRLPAALIGAVAAIGSAHVFYFLRKRITAETRIPDWSVGLTEDALVAASGMRLIDHI